LNENYPVVKHVFLFITFLFLGLCSRAQHDTIFQYTYGSIQNDVCNQVKVTKDKGYIMIGTTDGFCSGGGTNFYAVKVDSLGRHQWSNTYGGNESDEGYAVEPTFDSGYAFLGWTNSYGAGGYDVLLVKTDALGKVQWQKTYGGSDWDFGYDISQTADSGFVICGQTYSYGSGNGDVYVIRTDKNGDTLWTRTVGGAGYDIGNSVYVRNDSVYMIAGSTTSYGIGDTNLYLLKMNNKGVLEFDTTYGCTKTTVGSSIRGTQDGGYTIAGYTDSIAQGSTNAGADYVIVLRTDSNLRVEKTFNNWEMLLFKPSGIGYGKDAIECPDGNTVTVGTSNTDGLGGYAMFIARSFHQFLSAGPYEGGSGDEEGNSLAYNYANNNIVMAGASNSTGTVDTTNYTQGLFDYYLVRYKNDTDIKFDYQYIHSLIRFKDSVPCVTAVNELNSPALMAKVFPDPLVDEATVVVQDEMNGKCTFSIYNVMGQCVATSVMRPSGHGQLMTHITKGNLASGVYFYKVQASNNKTATGKIIVE